MHLGWVATAIGYVLLTAPLACARQLIVKFGWACKKVAPYRTIRHYWQSLKNVRTFQIIENSIGVETVC
jgi:hypothetical protein